MTKSPPSEGLPPGIIELARKWRKLRIEGDSLWAEGKYGNKGKARLKWRQAGQVAEKLANLIFERSIDSATNH